MEAEIIHAAGVRGVVILSTPQCVVLSYHPRAGVRGDFTSSRRRRVGVWDFVSLGESAARLGEALDPMAQILEVRLFDAPTPQACGVLSYYPRRSAWCCHIIHAQACGDDM